ncbi:DUF4861 family protein [Candidatus Latescibacterota bacterium]
MKSAISLRKLFTASLILIVLTAYSSYGADDGWYTEGNLEPLKRIKITVTNTLDIDRPDCPVIIQRTQLPNQNIPQRYITVVDPTLPSNPEPTQEELRQNSGYLLRKETYGHYLEYQMDDLDKDGIWDELFLMTDLKADETKTLYLYIAKAERGLYKHNTHAGLGYYGRHIVPFWESEHVGWKLWFPASVDFHGKREPMLTAYPEYSLNLSGYYMPYEYGSDIMTVSTTFGAGGIGLFEIPSNPDSVSRPEYDYNVGTGPFDSARYSYDVITNGPLRSTISAKTMNWKTGSGMYELEQRYTAYARKSYSTCNVTFTDFSPGNPSVTFCCGIREIMEEYTNYQNGGTVVSMGKDIEIRIPDEDIGDEGLIVEFEGIALVIPNKYKPEYKNINGLGGNHVFKIPVTPDRSFEYLIAGGWSQGKINTTETEFRKYVLTEALKYNNPPVVNVSSLEEKE